MPFPAKVVANEFLKLAKRDNEELSPMKLQKLVYFAHGWCLALTGEPLISERIEAWQYGPVIPHLYGEFKMYGNGGITSYAHEARFENGRFGFYQPVLDDFPASPERDVAKQIIDRVWHVYGKFTSARLSNATHVAGSPWSQVYEEGKRSIVIPDDKIRSYFEGLADAA